MYIPWGENLSFVPKSRSNINVTVFKKLAVAGAFVFHKHILFQVVFKRLILQGHIKMWVCVIELTLSQTNLGFYVSAV